MPIEHWDAPRAHPVTRSWPVLSFEGETTPSRDLLLRILAVGVAFDVAFDGQRAGLSFPLFVAVLVAALWNPVREARARALLGTAAAIAVFPALLAAEEVVALDALAVLGLLAVAVAYEYVDLLRLSLRGAALALLTLIGSIARLPGLLVPASTAIARGSARRRLVTAGVTLLVALPILALFAVLLASSDRVFADLLAALLPRWGVAAVARHVGLISVGALACAVLIVASMIRARIEPVDGDTRTLRSSTAQWVTVMVGVDVLFAVFVAVQFAVLFGGRARVDVTPGLTYAEYARSGFFQLIAVSGLAVLLIAATWFRGAGPTPSTHRLFRSLSTGLLLLTCVVIASAFMRLRLYEVTFGFTVTRFFAYAILVWITVMVVAVAVILWRGAWSRLLTVAIASGLVLLVAINLVNPERFVAARNIDRWRATGKVDLGYIGYDLGPDAMPLVAGLIPLLEPDRAARLTRALCDGLDRTGDDLDPRSFNLARSSARAALGNVGITPSACARASGPR